MVWARQETGLSKYLKVYGFAFKSAVFKTFSSPFSVPIASPTTLSLFFSSSIQVG